MSEPTPSQALLLFGLLARHGECAQAELAPAVKKADREAMVAARLVSVGKQGRGLYLRLEDAGWAWAGAHLSAELPTQQRALHDLLARLGEHLEKSGETLADFIGSKPAAAPVAKAAKPRRSAKTATPRRKAAAKPAAAKDSILAAYAEITGGHHGKDVPLADLRAKLPQLGRAAFDAALTELHLDGGRARLLRIEHARAVSDADREAALQFKGNVFHALWIDA
jgi:hypothetical protein